MEADTEPLRHHLRDHIWDGRLEKSMGNSHLLETSPIIETTIKSSKLESQRRPSFDRRRSLNPRRALVFYILLALLAMVVLRKLKYLVPSLLCLHSGSAALHIVPGAAWTDVSLTTYIVPFTCLIFFQGRYRKASPSPWPRHHQSREHVLHDR